MAMSLIRLDKYLADMKAGQEVKSKNIYEKAVCR